MSSNQPDQESFSNPNNHRNSDFKESPNTTAATVASNPAAEFAERKQKVLDLRAQNIHPYPEKFARTHLTQELKNLQSNLTLKTAEEIQQDQSPAPYAIAGRLMLLRPHGKLTFAQLQDVSGRLQLCFMQDLLGAETYKLLKKIDLGDFLGVKGDLFLTKHGELTLLVKEFQLLSKTLRPLPDKFHGLKDQESIYRYRYLELLTDPEAMRRFRFRQNFIKTVRQFLDENQFEEVETPVLNNTASGATATPFSTHHNALDIPMFLRIAPETYLKRCIVGGYEKVYEFARCFRNEGIDPSHLQEFTMLEFYASYWNFEDNMDFTQQLLQHTIQKLCGTLTVEILDRLGQPVTIDFSGNWPRYQFAELIKNDCGIDILAYTNDINGLLEAIKAQGIVIEKAETMGYGNLCDHLYKKVSRPKLIQPCFVTKHPVQTKPLARRNDQDARLADSFQLLLNTWEVVNAYSELVDPEDQRARLEQQAEAKAAGDEEAMPMDEDFLFAMEHGMPPMSGWGMGIDRIVALLTKQTNLKDVVLFPNLRPLENQ